MARFTDVLSSVFTRIARLWNKMNLSRRIMLLGGIGFVIVAVVLLAVLLPSFSGTAQAAAAEATPAPTPVTTPAPTVSHTPVPTTPPEESVDITLKVGDENESVSALQMQLMDLGFLDIDESTGYFGPATENAIKLFQRQYGMEQDGIASYELQMMLYADDAQHYMISIGTEGSDVASVQRQLIDLGYLKSGNATGYYGDATTEAVKAFQKANDLSQDGITGVRTLEQLYSPNAVATPERRQAVRARANIDVMISTAQAQLGKKYVLGNEGPNTFDCSGLVYYCLRQAGSNRGRYSAAGYCQVSDWAKITKRSDLRRGDLVFFWNNAHTKIGHVGIYIGNGMMIDASSSKGKVVKRAVFSDRLFYCGRRPW